MFYTSRSLDYCNWLILEELRKILNLTVMRQILNIFIFKCSFYLLYFGGTTVSPDRLFFNVTYDVKFWHIFIFKTYFLTLRSSQNDFVIIGSRHSTAVQENCHFGIQFNEDSQLQTDKILESLDYTADVSRDVVFCTYYSFINQMQPNLSVIKNSSNINLANFIDFQQKRKARTILSLPNFLSYTLRKFKC